jgi:hypothetical protein
MFYCWMQTQDCTTTTPSQTHALTQRRLRHTSNSDASVHPPLTHHTHRCKHTYVRAHPETRMLSSDNNNSELVAEADRTAACFCSHLGSDVRAPRCRPASSIHRFLRMASAKLTKQTAKNIEECYSIIRGWLFRDCFC